MGSRLELQEILEELLGSENVYFQPPETIKLVYPCIIYGRNNIDVRYADDNPYKLHQQYKITIIDKNPDSEIPMRMSLLPMSRFERHYTVDNLNHDVYNIYY